MGWGSGFGWMGWLWPLLMLVFWVGVIAAAVWLVGSLFGRSERPGSGGSDSAIEALKRRYAAGQITRDEYLEGRRILQG